MLLKLLFVEFQEFSLSVNIGSMSSREVIIFETRTTHHPLALPRFPIFTIQNSDFEAFLFIVVLTPCHAE